MNSRFLFVLCTIAIFLFVVTSVAVADDRYQARTRKLANAPWLGAPHFQALVKRGRFVFRDAPFDHYHDSTFDNTDDSEWLDKRNWRL